MTAGRVEQAPPGEASVPYVDISAIDRTSKKITGTSLVDSRTCPTRARQWVKTGDVLVSMTRPNLNAVALVPMALDGAVASTGFDVLRSIGVLPEWIFYRVQSMDFVIDVCRGLQGVVYPAIRPHDVRRHELPIPPAREQKRIVETIESYFSRLDDAGGLFEKVRRNLKRYRAAVLKAAVEGRLVPTEAELARAEGRDYEPADVLLKRILAERRHRWEDSELEGLRAGGREPRGAARKAKYEEPVGLAASSLPKLPDGWVWVTLDQLTVSIEGGTPVTATDVPSSRRVLRSSAVRSGEIDLGDVRYLPDDAPHKPDGYIRAGDLLITRLSGSLEYVGNCAVVPDLGERLIEFPDRLFRARLVDPVSPLYVEACFQIPTLRRPLERAAKSTAGHQRISLEDLRCLPLPLPPLVEQMRLATSLDYHRSLIRSGAVYAETALSRTGRLRQSVLRWAFEGRLVDQDPTDEPASVLLDRIRLETAGARAVKDGSRRSARRRQRSTMRASREETAR